jgi:hypothetical protein
LVIHSVIVDILGNAYYDAPRIVVASADALSDRIPWLTPIFASHVLRDDCHPASADQIVPGKIPPSDQPRAQSGEETG